MAIDGKLSVDAKCYENFSCAYFSEIMNAYRLWSSQEIKEGYYDESPTQKIYTDKEIDDLNRLDIENAYQLMRNGRVPFGLPTYFKDLLVKDGLMKQEDNLSSFFVQRLGRNVENIYVPA